MTGHLQQLRQRLAELTDLHAASHVLGWDQQTMMPPMGAAARAAGAELPAGDEDSDDARLVAVVKRRWEKARRVPADLAADLARAASIGQEAWVAARRESDFAAFAPYLQANIDLARRYVDCFAGEFECAYDALLDDYDPGTTSAQVRDLFAALKAELVPMIAKLRERSVDDACVHGDFPPERQRPLVLRAVEQMGFTPESWRLDEAVHPFATSFGSRDVRITTRWDREYFPAALFGAMHECGHGLYEAGIADELQRTPLGHAESLSLHESQSRLWENMVGRGKAFSGVLAPWVSEAFGRPVSSDALYRAVNRVKPSFIRVEADEATYGLHIILRFELEQELIEGRLAVAELPAAWNARFHEMFGIEVPDDANGVLQDVHWSAGLIGYFSTYALGNLVAGQLWERAHVDLPDLEASIAAGELQPLREWLREHVHRHGSKFTSAELLQRVVGGPIRVEPFVAYLKAKLGDVYETEL
jgi:carboxypeptidase Taq